MVSCDYGQLSAPSPECCNSIWHAPTNLQLVLNTNHVCLRRYLCARKRDMDEALLQASQHSESDGDDLPWDAAAAHSDGAYALQDSRYGIYTDAGADEEGAGLISHGAGVGLGGCAADGAAEGVHGGEPGAMAEVSPGLQGWAGWGVAPALPVGGAVQGKCL